MQTSPNVTITTGHQHQNRWPHARTVSVARAAIAVVVTLLMAVPLQAGSRTSRTGECYRINTTTGRRIDFDRITFESDEFVGHTFPGYEVRLPREQISRVRIQTGDYAAEGFIAGAAFGVAYWSLLHSSASNYRSTGAAGFEDAGGLAFFAAVLGCAGMTVGMKHPKWKSIELSDPRLGGLGMSLSLHF